VAEKSLGGLELFAPRFAWRSSENDTVSDLVVVPACLR
jgi:hypothetical protein